MVHNSLKYLVNNSNFFSDQLNFIGIYFMKNSWLGFILICFVIIIWFIKINIDLVNSLYLFKWNYERVGINISKNTLHKQFKYIIHRIVR